MLQVSIDSNIDEIEKKLSEITDRSRLVMMRAMNRTARNIATTTKREVASRYFVKQKQVADTLKISKASKSNLEVAVVSKGEKLELEKFKVSPREPVKIISREERTPKVYKAAVKKAGGLKPLYGERVSGKQSKPFFATTKKGTQGIFFRSRAKAYPIKQVMGPAIPQIIDNKEIMENIMKKANETLEKCIEHELSRVIK